ncbi:hypothetical protein, partial [Aliidiomarina maris]
KIHWVFSFLVWSPSSLAKLARLGRRLNEYQSQSLRQLFRCGFASTTKPRVLAALCFLTEPVNWCY